MVFQKIEKRFKKKCTRCGRMADSIKGNFGHYLCDRCSRIKKITKVNAITVPSHLLREYEFKNVNLYLESHPRGILIRKATPDEVGI